MDGKVVFLFMKVNIVMSHSHISQIMYVRNVVSLAPVDGRE